MSKRTGTFQYGWILLVVLLLAATLKIFVLDAVAVPSRSMEPAVLAGDFLILDKTGYTPRFLTFRTPLKGEVVAFTLPEGIERSQGDGGPLILKRCVASPGDTIAFLDGDLLVNGVRVTGGIGDGGTLAGDSRPRAVPRKGDTILLDSAGCALWGDFIEREGHSIGRDGRGAITLNGETVTSYLVEHDYIVVLGDNHPVSLDSRTWGFIPASSVIGKAVMIYWSLGEDGSVRWDRIGLIGSPVD